MKGRRDYQAKKTIGGTIYRSSHKDPAICAQLLDTQLRHDGEEPINPEADCKQLDIGI